MSRGAFPHHPYTLAEVLELHVIVGVKAVSLPLVLAGQRYTVEPLARAEVKQEPPWAQMGRGTLWNPSQELR